LQDFKPVKRLPTMTAAAVGRILARWSYQEWLLTETAYKLLRLDPKEGRVAVREPRAADYVTMIEDLLRIHRITIKASLSELRKYLVLAENQRDRYAHGVWLRHPQTRELYIRRTKGNWRPDLREPKINRKIKPEALRVIPSKLTAVFHLIDVTVLMTEKIKTEIERKLAP